MNLVPKRWPDGTIRTMPGDPTHVWVECEVVTPPSAAGRTMYVMFDPDAVTSALLAFRDAAAAARAL